MSAGSAVWRRLMFPLFTAGTGAAGKRALVDRVSKTRQNGRPGPLCRRTARQFRGGSSAHGRTSGLSCASTCVLPAPTG
jgi:hypothetical protein